MIEVIKYTTDRKKEWDEFVTKSDIPIFMFLRDYMEYHADRFIDHSLIIFQKQKIIALLPGHTIDNMYISHQGLTFGGLITSKSISYTTIQEVFNNINQYLSQINLSNVVLKAQPSIYSETQSQAQLYLLQSKLKEHSDIKLSTCIYTHQHTFPKSTIEKRKLKLDQFEFTLSDDFASFWEILENNLITYHNTKPVHSLDEIIYLHRLFPNGIRLFIARNKQTGEIDAGAVLYVFKNVVKLQYFAASTVGRKNRASHALYYGFITEYLNKVDYIDLGNCMDDIDTINYNLLYIKERFGATIYPMHSYQYSTDLTL